MKNILFLLILPISIFSQETVFKNFNWEEKPIYIITSDEDNKNDVIELKDKRIFELISEKDRAYEYAYVHSIKKLNTDVGIEKNNKVYVYESVNRKIIKNSLRVINPDGKVLELDNADIQEAIDQSTKAKYKYYAVRGLEKGSIIEQVIVTKSASNFDGKILNIQSENLTRNIDIQIVHPNYLIYEVKTYNGLAKAEINDSIYKDKIAHIVKLDSCEGIDDEKYSNYKANLKSIAYKLTGNRASNKLNINSFKSVAENVYSAIYNTQSSNDEDRLNDFCTQINFKENSTLEDSIKSIEHYIKNEIIFINEYETDKPSIATTIKEKKTNEMGMVKLMANAYKRFNIQTEIVLTNNRYDFPFDPKFENIQQLDENLLFFPKTKRFLSPKNQGNRYPHFSYQLGENYGLFIKTISLGGNDVVMSSTKKIPLESDYDSDSLDIQIDFTESLSNPSFIISNTLYGYDAENNQFILDFLDDKQKKEFANEYMKNYSGESESENQCFNYGKANIGQVPFIVGAKFSSNKLLEKNAENILFKLGESIGRQDELYQEKPRKTPVESTYPRAYIRRIRVKIPATHQFNNLEGIKLNFDIIEEGKSMAGFHSDYKQTETELDIYIHEYYNKINFPIAAYNDYKNVINAAADFNKVKIILSKKE